MQNDEHFINYYSRLLKDFASEVGNGDFRNIPQPFLPTFGDRYSSAARRIAFVGIETRGWGDAAEFLDKLSRSDPADLIRANLEEFRELEFVDWTNNFGSTFFDFVIAFLLLSNGFSPNLSAFKRQPNKEILRDFAWGNFNSVEEYETTAARGNASRPDWQKLKGASHILDGASHLINTLSPHVIIVLGRNRAKHYLGERKHDLVFESKQPQLRHYVAEPSSGRSDSVCVIEIPHPRSINYRKNDCSKEDYIKAILEILKPRGKAPADKVVIVASRSVVEAKKTADQFELVLSRGISAVARDKYSAVEWVAEQLRSGGRVMRVPELAKLLNNAGYTTNRGTKFCGDRGTYVMVRCVYHRCAKRGDSARATMVAEAFVKPDGTYAYD